MSLYFCSLASSSKGNCYLIKNDDAAILVDAGISGKKISQGLQEAGTSPEEVIGILLTHEHADHVKSLHTVLKKLPNVRAFANESTWKAISQNISHEKRCSFITGKNFKLGAFVIRSFPVPHDAADPVGFSIYYGRKQISIVADTGHITEGIFKEISNADLLLLEANHEEEVLLMSSYPYDLKRRILSDRGHLSNVSAGECLCRLTKMKDKTRQILLGHMSEENNDPDLALLSVRNTLLQSDIIPGKNLFIDIAFRDCRSKLFEV